MNVRLTTRPDRFTPGKRDPVTIVHYARRAPAPVWTGAESFPPPPPNRAFIPRFVQPVESRYTDWAIPAYICYVSTAVITSIHQINCSSSFLVYRVVTSKVKFLHCQSVSFTGCASTVRPSPLGEIPTRAAQQPLFHAGCPRIAHPPSYCQKLIYQV